MRNFNNIINVIAKDEEIIRNHIFSEEEEKELENLGYKVFVVASKKGASPKQINKDIDNVINSIIEYMESVF